MKVYAKTNDAQRIVFIALERELDEAQRTAWTDVGETTSDADEAAVLAGCWLGEGLTDEAGNYRYCLQSGVVQRLPDEELAKEEAPVQAASMMDRIEAQVIYTAMMTDTLLEV